MPRGRAPMRKSEPKASARNPRSSSAVEKRVYSAGAPSKAPAGAGCLPDAANAAVNEQIRKTIVVNDRCIATASGRAPQAHQAFLSHRGNQCAVAFEYKSTGLSLIHISEPTRR